LNIVMPMAGRGSRFAKVGIPTPKPLIDVLGKPMYAWATDSLPLNLCEKLIFISLREHLDETDLLSDIKSRYGQYSPIILPLDHVTDGQACTVLVAKELIDNEQPLIIFNADTFCRTSLDVNLKQMPSSVAGLLGVFRAPGDRWSFARTDPNGRVVETAEKRRISDLACTGLYHFSRGKDFVRYAQATIAANDRVNGEFYVAPVYNRMIADGMDIRVDIAQEAWALGTPEDLAIFLQHRNVQ
jgi:dTDP-glucose pyrophosphorylase